MATNFISALDANPDISEQDNLYNSLFRQYERVVMESLITSFGLDFLIGDKHGGDVDTVHNVRKIGTDPEMGYKNKANREAYDNRGEYNSAAYHSDPRFAQTKAEARQRYNETGQTVTDTYTGQELEYTKASEVSKDKRVELDHVVECKPIHDDRGRVLAGLNGVDLANNPDNLAFTNKSLNASMGSWMRQKNERWRREHGCDAPLDELSIDAYLNEYPNSPNANPEIVEMISDPETQQRMREQSAKSRKAYERQVNKAYYTSKAFWGDTAKAAGKLSLKMGLRAALGLVFAELWFAARDEIARIESGAAEMFRAIGRGIKKGLQNARNKYRELWAKFIDGAVAGVLSSLVTTLTNIFFTTAKSVVRIIRQSWASLVEATKILFINPDGLRTGERVRATVKVLATGASVVAGVMLNEAIAKTPFGTIPFVGNIAATFCGTLLTGIMSCSMLYLLDHNGWINNFVKWLDSLPTIENYTAYAHQQAEMLNRYAAKVYDLDVARFKRETTAISAALDNVTADMDDRTLLLSLQEVYGTLGFELPWGNNRSFDNFMNERSVTLTFR